MPILDYKRFGVTIDDVNAGRFSYIIGFDLGDGELSAAYWNLREQGFTKPIDLKFDINENTKVVSALFVNSNKKVIGGTLGSMTGLSDAEGQLFLNFKVPPARLLDGELYEGTRVSKLALMRNLLFYHLSKIFENNKLNFEGKGLLVIGCPSSPEWLDNNMDVEYAKTLQEGLARLKRDFTVVVIPESRASLMKVYKENVNDIHVKVENGIIVVDHGSSTLDVTVIDFANNHQSDFSIPLGAKLIERKIREVVLRDRRRRVNELLAPDFQLMSIRNGKEAHYAHPESSPKVVLEFTDESMLKAILSGELFNRTTHEERVRYSTEEEPLVEGPWSDLHVEFLTNTARRCGITPSEYNGTILMTGGASRMQFVRDNAAKVFPKATIVCDTEPSFCVSRGLAWGARSDLNAMKLTEKVREEVRRAIQLDTKCFRHTLGQELAPVIYSYILPEVEDWVKNGANVTPRQMQKKMADGLINPQTPSQQEWSRKVHEALQSGVRKYFTNNTSTSLRNVIALTVNRVFSQEFPGKINADNIKNFHIDNDVWNNLVKEATSENGPISGVISSTINFDNLLGSVIGGIFYFVIGTVALALFIFSFGLIDFLDSVDKQFDKADSLLSDSKRMKVYTHLRDKKSEVIGKIVDSFAASKIGDDGKITEAIINAVRPALETAVNNVSLYF